MVADNVSWPRRQLNYSVTAMLLPERLVDSFGMRCNALARIIFYAHGVFAPNTNDNDLYQAVSDSQKPPPADSPAFLGPAGYLPAEFLLAIPTNPIRPMTTTHTAIGTEP